MVEKFVIGAVAKMISSEWVSLVPFIGITGKQPSFNVARLIETFIIAGVTMWGTVQVQAAKLEAIVKVTEEMRQEVTAIRLERAGRVQKIDAELAALHAAQADHEVRLRKSGR